VDVGRLGGFVAVEQSDRVLAPVASEVAVVASIIARLVPM
jgi:hypothetical protein